MSKSKTVLVGLSGGVDSSVAACLLKEQGYNVIGIHLKFWADPKIAAENKCCSNKDLTKLLKITKQIDIPLHVINLQEEFKEKVVDYFINSYKEGITPNPCIECNRNIKFGIFLDKMKEFNADFVATGHYVRKEFKEGIYELHSAKDEDKDQSYFLYTLTQEKLAKTLFPLGDYKKSEIRKLAEKFGIEEVNNQKESQNACFFPEKTPEKFLKRYVEKTEYKPGPIMTTDEQKIGEHTGLLSYTIGQRKGLGVGGIKGYQEEIGEPWYVIRFNRPKNSLIVGQDKDLHSTSLEANQLTFINHSPGEKMEIFAKIRSRISKQKAKLSIKDGKASVEFIRPQRAITPGQSVVFYKGDKVLGGGIIL